MPCRPTAWGSVYLGRRQVEVRESSLSRGIQILSRDDETGSGWRCAEDRVNLQFLATSFVELRKVKNRMTDLKTVVGLYDDLGDARQAVAELKGRGFGDAEVSLVANASTEEYHRYFDTTSGAYRAEVVEDTGSGAGTGAGIGAILGGIAGLLAGLSIITIPGVGPILGAGPVASTLMGAVAGGLVGGLLGALTDLGVPEEHAGYYSEGVRRGGTLVIVKTNVGQVDQATNILQKFNPVDVEQRVSSWRQGGWTGYDPKSDPYTAERIAEERRTYLPRA
jgi:hypothetical protein